MNPAPNLVLVGPMGAGKSSIGRRLAGRFGLSFVDADREIEARTGATVTTIFACEGEPGFRARERAALVDVLAREAAVIATGGGAILDPDNRALLVHGGFVVYLQVGLVQQAARLARDRTRPLLAGPDRDQVLRQLANDRDPLYRDVADLCFDTDAFTTFEAAQRLGTLLDGCWQRCSRQPDALAAPSRPQP